MIVTPINFTQVQALEEYASELYSSSVQKSISNGDYGVIQHSTNLLDISNETIAQCIDFDNAYIIYDMYGNIVEECSTSQSPYVNHYNENCYYGGPLMYFTYHDDAFIHINSHIRFSSEEFVEYVNNFSSECNENQQTIVMSNSLYKSQTSLSSSYYYNTYYAGTSSSSPECLPRTLNYNTTGTCSHHTMQLYYLHGMMTTKIVQLSPMLLIRHQIIIY